MKFLGLSREAASMTAGMMVAVVAFAAWWGPLWPLFLIGAALCAPFLGIFAVAPVYLCLKRRGQLRIWWAVLAGAMIASLPNLVIALPTVLFSSAGSYASVNGEALIDFGRVTTAGWYHYLVLPTLALAPFGILGAVVAWLLAYGFRLTPPVAAPMNSPDDSGAIP